MQDNALLGDKHNFGRSVELVGLEDGLWFEKPRPVFWEFFYFGTNSPVRKVLEESDVANDLGCDFFFFNLEVVCETNLSGRSRQIIAANQDSSKLMSQFGVLLAYCYILGIQDLHAGNLIISERGIQVLDVEVVGSYLHLPHETLLLPFKQITARDCGFGVAGDANEISLEDGIQVLNSFIACVLCFVQQRDLLLSLFRRLRSNLAKIPIRVILRDTFKYRPDEQVKAEPALLASEKEQLSRGDVPYFFKFYDDTKVYAYISKRNEFSEVEIKDARLQLNADKVASDPAILLSESRLKNEILFHGSLYLLRTLFPKNKIFKWKFANLDLQLGEDIVSVHDGSQIASASRKRVIS